MTTPAIDFKICSMGAYNGHLYKVIGYDPRGSMTWHHAKDHAASLPPLPCGAGHLVTITSQGESDFVTSLLMDRSVCGDGRYDAWIGITNAGGLNRGDDELDFSWVTGESNDGFQNWCPGQPSQRGEAFGEVWIDEVGASNGGEGTNPMGCWNDNEADTRGPANGADNDKYIVEYDCLPEGLGTGDPHFETWMSNSFYDYQGECDLTFVDAPGFSPDAALKINVRTTIRYEYSFIETVAFKVGDDILEISGYGNYFYNGVYSGDIPNTLGPMKVSHKAENKKTHFYELTADENTKIVVKTHKDMVSVKIEKADPARFGDSRGLLGDFKYGQQLGRNGTVIEDPIAFAEEWQVRDDEPMLFQAAREPQYPRSCRLPEPKSASAQRRRLGESVALDAAKKACANWEEGLRAACVHDVMATGDLGVADIGL